MTVKLCAGAYMIVCVFSFRILYEWLFVKQPLLVVDTISSVDKGEEHGKRI